MTESWNVSTHYHSGEVVAAGVTFTSVETLVSFINSLRRAADAQGWATQLFDEIEELLAALERRRGPKEVYWRGVWGKMIHTGDIKQDSLTSAVWLKRRLAGILKDLEETGGLIK